MHFVRTDRVGVISLAADRRRPSARWPHVGVKRCRSQMPGDVWRLTRGVSPYGATLTYFDVASHSGSG